MKKVEANFTERTLNCLECQRTFSALIGPFGMVLGGGLCIDCRNRKIKEEEERVEAVRVMDIAKKRAQWRNNCGIPMRYINEEFGTFKTDRPGNVKKAYERCLEYANCFPLDYASYRRAHHEAYPSLVLQSPQEWGVGKTHLACSIVHNILNRWKGENVVNPVVYVNEPDIYRRIRETYSFSNEEKKYRESEGEIMAGLMNKPLLVLDDIGKEEPRDPKFVQRILYEIINARYDNLLPVVMTTNLDTEGLKNYLGSNGNVATFDRLFEMCEGKFFRITGESYRRKK